MARAPASPFGSALEHPDGLVVGPGRSGTDRTRPPACSRRACRRKPDDPRPAPGGGEDSIGGERRNSASASEPDAAQAVEREARSLYTKLVSPEALRRRSVSEVREYLRTLNTRPSWKVLTPTTLTSEGGATLVRHPDGSILAGGKNSEKDTYSMVATTEGGAITAIRLEVLADPSLANNGPGRHEAGNFHLTAIALSAASSDAPSSSQAVPLGRAIASYTRPPDHDTTLRDGPRGAIDGTHATRWDIWPQVGKTNVAYFEPSRPAGGAGPETLTFRLHFRDPVFQHVNLGRFRLSVTSDPYPLAIERWQATEDLGGLAGAYYASGDFASAIALLEPTIAQTGGDALSWLALALCYAETGRMPEAHTWYDKAQGWLQQKPSDDGTSELALLAKAKLEGLPGSKGLR